MTLRYSLRSSGRPYTQDLVAPLPVVLRPRMSSGSTQYVYSMGTRPLAEYESAVWEYLLADGLGSVRQIVDANGDVTLLESYQPYGEVLDSAGSATSVFGYTGEQMDGTGLVFLRARYMRPGLGIFLSRDPWSGDVLRPGSMNGWSYVEGNPVNYVDPGGNSPHADKLCDEWGWAGNPKHAYCIPSEDGNLDATVNLVILIARAMPTPFIRWHYGAKNLNHFIWGDGTDKTYPSRWYLNSTLTKNAVDDIRRRVVKREDIRRTLGECNTATRLTDSIAVSPEGDVKAAIGRHYIHATVGFGVLGDWPFVPSFNVCDCPDRYLINYRINDFYNWDPVDGATGEEQFLPLSVIGLGFGDAPFRWLDDLARKGRAKEFFTRVFWMEEIDAEKGTVVKLIHDLNVTLPK